MAKYTLPPRQKMINLLYVVLIAMLAINISSDVLEGYGRMNNDYLPQIKKLEEYNRTLLERINSRNDKAALSAQNIDAAAGKLMDTLEELKEDIARKADKEKYEAGKLKAKDDLNAVPEVFLSVTGGKGKALRLSLDTFKEDALSLIKNDAHRQLVGTYLNTESPGTGISWEKETFSYLPAIGGVTFINKMQEEVLMCVNEVYRSLLYEEAEDGKGGAFVFINEDQMIVNKDGTVDLPVVQITPALTSILYTDYENPLNILTAGNTVQRGDIPDDERKDTQKRKPLHSRSRRKSTDSDSYRHTDKKRGGKATGRIPVYRKGTARSDTLYTLHG